MSPPRGSTLVEVLVASAVLAFLTLIGMGVLKPALQKAAWSDRHQDRIQGSVVCREQLNRILDGARLLDPVEPESISFIRPHTVESEWGELGLVDETESLSWNEDEPLTLLMDAGGTLVVVNAGGETRRALWRLGAGAGMEVRFEGTPFVTLHFTAPAVDDSPPWETDITLYVRGIP